jgi:anthranilate/para-aminobenzoate synthase component II
MLLLIDNYDSFTYNQNCRDIYNFRKDRNAKPIGYKHGG